MTTLMLDVWKCARKVCGWEGLPVMKNFGELGEAPTCGRCGTEDVFPKNDGGWDRPEVEPGGRRAPSHDPSYDDN